MYKHLVFFGTNTIFFFNFFLMSKVLMYCITSQLFTLRTFNDIIIHFKYGHREVIDRPSAIEYSHLKAGTIHQSAVQTWLLAVTLPLMIGHFIDRGDPVWHCYITLLEICRLIFLDSISQFEIVKLELLIEELCMEYTEKFFQSYKRDDPKSKLKCKIIPKMHHLVHYPRYIRLLGPLHSFRCMRFEAKHSYFKQLQRKIKNFIDPPYTLSIRHQQWQCHQFRSSKDRFLSSSIVISPFKVRLLGIYSFAGQVASLLHLSALDISVREYKWVNIGSNKFTVNETLIVCPLSFNEKSVQRSAFGLIANILAHNDKFVFVCQMYRTLRFDKHFQSLSKENLISSWLCSPHNYI